jgi:hypothetical protein
MLDESRSPTTAHAFLNKPHVSRPFQSPTRPPQTLNKISVISRYQLLQAPMSTSYFHEEVVMEILNRLPPKSLFQFRCVCKIWQNLIGNPDFFSPNNVPLQPKPTDSMRAQFSSSPSHQN